jgi:hypothetical protein
MHGLTTMARSWFWRIPLALALGLIWASLQCESSASDPSELTFESAQAGLLQRRFRIAEREFHYRSKRSSPNYRPKVVEFEQSMGYEMKSQKLLYEHPKEFDDVLTVKFVPSNFQHPFQFRWVSSIRESAKPWLTCRYFIVDDGERYSHWYRPDLQFVPPARLQEIEDYFRGIQGHGTVDSIDWARLHYISESLFVYGLTFDMRTMSAIEDPYGERSQAIGYVLQPTDKFQTGGRDCQRFELTRPNGVHHIVDIIPAPHFAIVRNTMEHDGMWCGIQCSEMEEKNGFVFPKKGVIRHEVTDTGVISQLEFEMVDVFLHRERPTFEWPPSWPAGSVVQLADNEIIEIPFPDGFKEEVIQGLLLKRKPSKSKWGWIAVLAGIALVGLLWYRRRARNP